MKPHRAKRGRPSPAPEAARPFRRDSIAVCLILFAVALTLRLLFWKATPDSDWPYSIYFKGDAVIWLEYAHAIRTQQPFELGLPIHPPGTACLIASLWNGKPSGIPFLKSVWVFLGSLTVVFLYLAALRSFGLSVASLAAGAAAASTGLMILSTSLNNETPYLLLVAVSFCFFGNARHRPGVRRLAIWSALQGLACLFRVEHFLFYLLMLGFLALLGWRSGAAGKLRGGSRPGFTLAVSLVFFLLPLIPWHLKAWSAIERFNTRPLSLPREAAVRRVEELLGGMAWDEAALKKREKLPAFIRRTAATFVAATVAYRGGQRVGEEDFRILEEAFGYYPRPLSRFPFVSSYGPLNFHLGNNYDATGGFSRSPLEEPPPLSSVPDRYPPSLIQALPPEALSFLYPPHLKLFNEGYSLGWKWIREHPADYLALALQKLRLFWSGSALGFTGYNLPLGLSGVRPAVDLVVPESGWGESSWRLAIFLLCILGVIAGWKRVALYPWLLFLASKVFVTLLFFGYARQGATVIPVVALLLAVAADRWLLGRFAKLPGRVGTALAVLLLLGVTAIEATRLLNKPTIWIDGRAVAAGDPFGAGEHRDRRIEVR